MPVRSKSDGLGMSLHTIELPTEPMESVTGVIKDCRYIGSYDWSPDATKNNPSIVIPGMITSFSSSPHLIYHRSIPNTGSPNIWTEPRLPIQIPPDQGRQIRDNNNYILKGQPFLPLLVAINEQQIFPHKEWKSVDLITDRSGLRKLLRWIGGVGGRDFRIDTQLVGDRTIIFNRWEAVDTELMHGNTFSSNFAKTVTKPMPPSTERSSWHHRVVTYVGRLFIIIVWSW